MDNPLHQPMGYTRSRTTSHYALLTPDTHVEATLPGWVDAQAMTHISPEMGARFTQCTVTLADGGRSAAPAAGASRFVYVLEGAVNLQHGKSAELATELSAGQYVYLPPRTPHQITASSSGARLALFEKNYQPVQADSPKLVAGTAEDVPGEAFQGDADLQLQTLLPTDEPYDMAMNIFTYQPGGRLPQVEVHVMEHGLLMLQGEGIYRLGDDWHPVQAGDIIWMASYCPQWFVAMGKEPAKYLYYKDVNRAPLIQCKLK